MDIKSLEQSSSLAWIINGGFVTENGKPIEFVKHRYLIDYLMDEHEDICGPKAAQIGATVIETLDEIHKAAFQGLNTIHTLQNQDVISGFVVPKVNPIIYENPGIKKLLVKDSQNLKQFQKGFVFYRGAQVESQAINISADILKIDEQDRSNQRVVEMFQSRLDNSDYKRIRRFSNPSAIGFGVDALWQTSNQFHWMVKCSHCNYTMYIDFEQEKNDVSHYTDQERLIFACGKCHKEIYDADRINGFWVPKFEKRTARHGYWFSQTMTTHFNAADIVKKYNDNSTDYFFNFVMGKAYTPSDLRIDRDTILKNTRYIVPMLRNVVMGTDVGKPHWYWLANPSGYFKCGKTDSWEELERIFIQYNCEAWVIDSMPEFTMVQRMVRKYPGKVYACQFVRDSKNVGAVRWMEGDKYGIVQADRTKVIDRIVNEESNGSMPNMMRFDDVEDYIKHASSMYRTVDTDDKGTIQVHWRTIENKPDHLVFAKVYTRIALEKAFSASGSGVVETKGLQDKKTTPMIIEDTVTIDMQIEESLNRAQRSNNR